MNKKAESFKKYLDEKNITCFTVEEIAGDALNTVAFRSSIVVEGQNLPTVLLLDSSIYCMVRVLLAPQALREENEVALLKAVNVLNGKYKAFKYYFDATGALVLDSCVMTTGEADGDLLYTVLDVIIRHLQTEYRPLMQTIWR